MALVRSEITDTVLLACNKVINQQLDIGTNLAQLTEILRTCKVNVTF